MKGMKSYIMLIRGKRIKSYRAMKELSQEDNTLESLLVYIDRCHKGHPNEETVVASIFDVARYILHELGSMNTWKLQKLCYYAQA